ncbi:MULTISPECIES: methionyl-tRNA formyltransferase [Rhodomicrobium]|uniref:methionyl-tRNA formyltransferase n=1 Tax=Rhodomicrobium TaxID=1068 RepID=UPI0014825028|nr:MULTISPECIES: methionyl-tRNA formyltransferase [Rhodomicrobium]
MRLIVMGQKAFGRDCLEKILDAGHDEVVAVYCAPDDEGKGADPLKAFALSKGLPVHQPANLNEEPTLETLRSHDADLMVMAYTTMFAPKAARDIPRLGSICFHPSLLPRHRGPSALNWPIIWGETKSGFSWFYPADGLDGGDLALQWECDIGSDDTVIDLYFKKIFPAGVESVLQVCDLFRSGNPPRVAQDETAATYEGWCRKRHAKIDWARPVAEVYNLIRGTNPAPGAWTTYAGSKLDIFDSRSIAGSATGAPGEVLSLGTDGMVVAADGGAIRVIRVRPAKGAKMPAAAWAAEAGVSPGDRLGE